VADFGIFSMLANHGPHKQMPPTAQIVSFYVHSIGFVNHWLLCVRVMYGKVSLQKNILHIAAAEIYRLV